MTTPPELSRRVRQLDNDIGAVYELVNAIQITQGRHGLRLGEIVDAQVAQGTVLDAHTVTLAEHGSKLDRIIALLEAR